MALGLLIILAAVVVHWRGAQSTGSTLGRTTASVQTPPPAAPSGRLAAIDRACEEAQTPLGELAATTSKVSAEFDDAGRLTAGLESFAAAARLVERSLRAVQRRAEEYNDAHLRGADFDAIAALDEAAGGEAFALETATRSVTAGAFEVAVESAASSAAERRRAARRLSLGWCATST
jgi:hypothetical protein